MNAQKAMFLPVHNAKNSLYAIQQDKSRHPTPLQWLFLLGSVIIGAIILRLFVFNQPSTYYDRALDSQLLQYVYVSPSARSLPKKGQLMCWAMTAKNYHDTRAVAVNQTWIHRCDHGQFFTNAHFEQEQNIPYSTVFAGIPDSYDNLFFKSRYAFHYIYTNLSKDFDWYMKADDDTYVIVEHLKEYLGRLNPDLPYYIGYRLRPYLEHGYNAGGAGYVLSRAALKIFSEHLYPNTTLCPDDKYEDVGIGRCLSNVGIYPLDTRNSKGQQRFNTFRPNEVFHGSVHESPYWIYDQEIKGFDSVGADLISFHHLSPDEIRLFDILLYRVNRPSTKKE